MKTPTTYNPEAIEKLRQEIDDVVSRYMNGRDIVGLAPRAADAIYALALNIAPLLAFAGRTGPAFFRQVIDSYLEKHGATFDELVDALRRQH